MSEGTNGLDRDAATSFVDQIERHMSDLLSERGSYMARCRGIREAITGVYDDAKYELLVEAVSGLEGTPLGDAAVERDKREGRGKRVRKAPVGSALDKLDTATDPRPAA